MKIIHDIVFGNLQYNHSWEKEEDLYFRNEKKQIMVVIEAYTDQEILDIQRQQYLVYQQKKNEYINKIPKVLLKYYLDNYDLIAAEMEIPEVINKENINEQLIVNYYPRQVGNSILNVVNTSKKEKGFTRLKITKMYF